MSIFQLCVLDLPFIVIHLLFLRNMRIIRCFCICFIFFIIFKLYSITSFWRKSPWLQHFSCFNRRVAIWTRINIFFLVSKPVALCANENISIIFFILKVILCLIRIISKRPWMCVTASTFICGIINSYEAAWCIFTNCNSNISFRGIFYLIRIPSSARRWFLYKKADNVFGKEYDGINPSA